jgi:antitoxin component YwqK of YwqJK toxin-antitoxin module
MKSTLAVVLLIICSYTINAQEHYPTFVGVGSLIKGVYFHNNGEVAQTGWFLDGKLQGEWTTYDEVGNKIAQRHYHDGERTGKWFFWDSDGDTLREVSYENGRMKQIVEWNNNSSR